MKKQPKTDLRTGAEITWCPGCFNYSILAGFEKFMQEELKRGNKKEDFAIITGIGCHGKIFDYLNIQGLNALHGRSIPIGLGMKIAKPKLKVFCFEGDGDAYSEGIEHLIHAARYNSDFKCIVHNNQVFALTVGQPNSVTERGFKDKTNPIGVKQKPLNPIKIMISAGASFVARVFAEPEQVKNILLKAQEHKGFAFIEIIQPCIIFHNDKGYKEKTYFLNEENHNNKDYIEAIKKADEWDYDGIKENTKIPLGIFYQKERETYEDTLEK
jgi:2-oxoglutarate ferredoxin oxidoreductase subunit beta